MEGGAIPNGVEVCLEMSRGKTDTRARARGKGPYLCERRCLRTAMDLRSEASSFDFSVTRR